MKKLRFLNFEKNAFQTILICFPSNFEIAPNIFSVVNQPQIDLFTQMNNFKKKFFLHAKFNFFRVHNAVLNTLMLDFFFLFA